MKIICKIVAEHKIQGKAESGPMRTVTYEATVENGQIKLPGTVLLPEHTKVFVVVPGVEPATASHIRSPRLVHPEDAADFIKVVVEESQDA